MLISFCFSNDSGNPKRYVCNDVVRMEAVRKRRHTPSNTPDGPTEDIETEGEKQLKNLLQKQLDTDVTLHR